MFILIYGLQRSPYYLKFGNVAPVSSSAFSCVLGNKMPIDFKNEEEVKEYLENLGIEYRYGCFSEKNPEACQLLGDYLDAVKKDYDKAVKIYKANCDDYNFPRSCHSYGTLALLGKGFQGKRNEEEAINYFTKACDLKVNTSCFNAGLLYISTNPETKRERDYMKGVQLLEKGCNLNHDNSCYILSGLYITGSTDGSIGKDMKTAFTYSQKACDLGNMFGCANCSLMYKRGEGVEKNLEMAEKYKKKAQQIQDDLKSSLHIELQRGSN